MGVYYIEIPEIHVVTVEIHLDEYSEKIFPEEKIDLLKDLAEAKVEEGKEESVEYSHTLKKDFWTVRKIK